jgi:hypothetical protein
MLLAHAWRTIPSLAGGDLEPEGAVASLGGGAGEPRGGVASLAGGDLEPEAGVASLAGGDLESEGAAASLAGGDLDPEGAVARLAGGDGEPRGGVASFAGAGIEPPEALDGGSAVDAVRAFDRQRWRRDALERAEVSWPNLEIAAMVGTALAAERRIAALLPEMEGLPGFDARDVRDLRDIALAAAHAHAVFVRVRSPAKALFARGRKLFRTIAAQASALAGLGLLDGHRVAAARRGKSNEALAKGLIAVSDQMLAHWPAIAHAASIGRPLLEDAYALGHELIERLPAGSALDRDGESPGDVRARAFTVLVRAYAQARRAVMFLRWDHGDADAIAPSLYRSRCRGAR